MRFYTLHTETQTYTGTYALYDNVPVSGGGCLKNYQTAVRILVEQFACPQGTG